LNLLKQAYLASFRAYTSRPSITLKNGLLACKQQACKQQFRTRHSHSTLSFHQPSSCQALFWY